MGGVTPPSLSPPPNPSHPLKKKKKTQTLSFLLPSDTLPPSSSYLKPPPSFSLTPSHTESPMLSSTVGGFLFLLFFCSFSLPRHQLFLTENSSGNGEK